VKRHGWRDLDPAVLAELRKIAAIRENPYVLMHAQYVSLHNQHVLQNGGALDDLIVPPITEAEQFDSKIKSAVWVAHLTIALSSPKKLTARKQIARCARELADTLQALRRDDKEILLHFLPHRRASTFEDFITATRELAHEARDICSLAGRPSSWQRRQARRSFVNLLLEAADDVGGKLTLNKRNERGSLKEAVDLLLPFLPPEFSKGLSFSVLSRLRRVWVQNRKRKSSRTPG
jgi:hypothetical protein